MGKIALKYKINKIRDYKRIAGNVKVKNLQGILKRQHASMLIESKGIRNDTAVRKLKSVDFLHDYTNAIPSDCFSSYTTQHDTYLINLSNFLCIRPHLEVYMVPSTIFAPN